MKWRYQIAGIMYCSMREIRKEVLLARRFFLFVSMSIKNWLEQSVIKCFLFFCIYKIWFSLGSLSARPIGSISRGSQTNSHWGTPQRTNFCDRAQCWSSSGDAQLELSSYFVYHGHLKLLFRLSRTSPSPMLSKLQLCQSCVVYITTEMLYTGSAEWT